MLAKEFQMSCIGYEERVKGALQLSGTQHFNPELRQKPEGTEKLCIVDK